LISGSNYFAYLHEGQLQLRYAENKEQEDEAINWIYSRYKEIRDMDMVADIDRVEDIIECYEKLMAE